jgi:uncharacterized protein (TIGR00369 family)
MLATALDKFSKPPAAELLGTHVLDARPKEGWVRMGFEGRLAFTNPAGFIQGGFLAAMLDDTMGPAALILSEGAAYTVTINMTVSFLSPARPGPLFGEGRVLQLGKTIGFLEAWLTDEKGVVVARATSSVRIVPAEKLPARAAGGNLGAARFGANATAGSLAST